MKKALSVKESLAKLETQTLEEPEPIQSQPPPDVTQALINLQNRTAGITTAQEALIDLLKAFDIINMDIFNIAFQNVLEYDKVPEESSKVFKMRLQALKKKLADYSKSQKPQKGKRSHG